MPGNEPYLNSDAPASWRQRHARRAAWPACLSSPYRLTLAAGSRFGEAMTAGNDTASALSVRR